jgi:hypothetical protein
MNLALPVQLDYCMDPPKRKESWHCLSDSCTDRATEGFHTDDQSPHFLFYDIFQQTVAVFGHG